MSAHRVLTDLLNAPHLVPDPGNAGIIKIDRDALYCNLAPATTETRTLNAPLRAGLTANLSCTTAQTVVVTVKNSAAGTTGTITLTAAGQWIGLKSYELTTGVYSWQATDVYGCTTTVQTAQNWSAAVAAGTMTDLNVSTGATIAAAIIPALSAAALVGTNVTLASNITALTGVFKSINCSTGMTANALTAGSAVVSTNLTVRSLISASSATAAAGNITALTALGIANTNLTVASVLNLGGALNLGASVFTSGGTSATNADTKWSTVQQLTNPINFVSATDATHNYFRLPAAVAGLACEAINIHTSRSASIIGAVSGVPIANFSGPTTHLLVLGCAGVASNAAAMVNDGTTWWQRVS